MDEITSVNNQNIKEITKLHQKKYREANDYFLVEGKKALEEILNANIEIKDVFLLKNSNLNEQLDANKVTIVTEPVMKKLSTTDSIPDVITIAKKPIYNIADLTKLNKIALLENIKDAGNFGTIIRSAAAFGIDAILLTGDTVDIYNTKVIRSAAGNFFKLPILEIEINDLRNTFKDFKFISTGLKCAQNITLSEPKKLNKTIFMFGSEADGLSQKVLDLADNNLVLDMNDNVESLNLAVASSIVFYELFKTS